MPGESEEKTEQENSSTSGKLMKSAQMNY
jgi:hypothetical protein